MNEEFTTGCTLKDHLIKVDQRVKATDFDYSKQPKEDIKVCDLCCNSGFKLYSHSDRYCLPVRSMICESCGLIFISPRMTKEAYNTFYSDWYRILVDAFNSRGEHTEQLDMVREHQAKEVCEFLKKHLPAEYNKKKLLDVGGSTGVLADKIVKQFGFKQGVVVDPSAEEIKRAKLKGLMVCTMGFEDYAAVYPKEFSLITMVKTIEHLQSIRKTLEKICMCLTDDGFLFVDCIDHNWLAAMCKSKQLSTKVDHVYQLTERTVERYFEQAGFDVIAVERNRRYLTYLLKKIDVHCS